jgi:putative ABC transport system permease protein
VGLILATWSIRLLVQLSPADLRGLDEVTIDGPVLAFTITVAFLSALLFGLIPAALGSRGESTERLQGNARTAGGRGQTRVQSTLVVAETALGVVLLIGAGLMLRSFHRLSNTDPGFEPEQIVTARFGLPEARYPYARQIQFYDELLRDVAAVPGLQSTAAAAPLPLGGAQYRIGFDLPDAPAPPSQRQSADVQMISPGYFRTMQIPVVSGRDISPADTLDAPMVVVINESFARQHFPGRDPIGLRIRPGLATTESEPPWREIVGVVRDVRLRLREPSRPAYFIPYAQGLISALYLITRTDGDRAAAVEQMRRALAAKDPELALYDVKSMEEYIATSVAAPRFQMLLLSLFACLALTLTAIGLYGVVAYGVAQRMREFGIRLALGAQPRQVLQLVLLRAVTLVGRGLVAGIAAAVLATRFLTASLYEIQPLDPLTFAIVPGILVAVAILASGLPARRATRVDPIRALRTD